jgi:hypothetical protein
MKSLKILQWYNVLRVNYRFSVFHAIRSLCMVAGSMRPLVAQSRHGVRGKQIVSAWLLRIPR